MESNKNKKKHQEDAKEAQNDAAGDHGPEPRESAEAPAAGNGADKARNYYDQLLRLQADFENYRKRVEKEKPELVSFGKAQILLTLLPLYDLLMQAHLHISKARGGGGEEPARMQDVVKGLEMIFREFSKVFEAEGIRPMELVGRPYDPMASEIIGIDEGTEENDGLVTEEFQKGFYYGDKILRPARVKIAKKKAAVPAETAEEGNEQEKQVENDL
ncbi:MAG: nucleotide exchange factor GrpE [Elusimicrobia bacterium]|nr:nucleotide exchange factor GrpE [Elusimicrobiota bacterium]